MHVSHWFGPEGGRAAYSTLVATVINQDPSVAPEVLPVASDSRLPKLKVWRASEKKMQFYPQVI